MTVSITIAGTALNTFKEWDVVSGARTIVVTLIGDWGRSGWGEGPWSQSGDTWVAAGATFEAQRQAIINGLDSAGSDVNGWNAEVRDKILVASVVRTSSTVVTIILPVIPHYDITSDETITVTIPGAALTGGSGAAATPTFSITADVLPTVTNNDTYLPPTPDYLICDRTGYKVTVDEGLVKEWTGNKVRSKSYEERHPQDFVKVRPEKLKGSPRPEQTDRFVTDVYTEVSLADLD